MGSQNGKGGEGEKTSHAGSILISRYEGKSASVHSADVGRCGVCNTEGNQRKEFHCLVFV